MASKTVQPLVIDLGIKGAEKLAGLKSSFRDLAKTVGLTDSGLEEARQGIIKYAKSANQSEALIRGQIKAFEGLREQATMGGKVYRGLSSDITELKAQLNGSTSAIDAQRKSLLETAGSAKVTQAQLLSVANSLSTLQQQTALGSKAFVELGNDIASLQGKIAKVKAEQQDLQRVTLAGNQAAAGGATATRLQIRAIDEKVASLREEKRVTEELSRQGKIRLGMQALLDRPGDVPFRSREYIEGAVASSLLGENITKMFGAKELQSAIDLVQQSVAELQNQVEVELGRSARRAFQEMAREGRESARSLALAFSGPEFERIFSNLERNVGELPNTTAGLSQRLRELDRVLNNTERSSVQYRRVSEEISRVQKELAKDVYSYSEALENLARKEEAAARRRSKLASIGEYFGAVSALGTEAAAGRTARGGTPVVADPGGYRDPATGAIIASGRGMRRDRLAYQEAQEMEQIADLQKVVNGLADEHVESLRSALRTMDEYEQKLGDDIVRRYEEETAAQNQAHQSRVANDEDAFRKELERVNILSQARKAAASALGIGGREDISSLYQGIIGLSTADIRRQQEMMGKSATEVFNDIATAFEKGGRAVDLKQKSTSIGNSIAEGVVDGASDSNEINSGAKTFAQRLIAAYKAALRIKSPSGEAKDKIGVPIGQGITEGAISAIDKAKFADAIQKALVIDLKNKIRAQIKAEIEAAFKATARMLPQGRTRQSSGLGLATENVLRMRDVARRPSESDRLLAAGGYQFQQLTGQEYVIQDFLNSLRSATAVFNTYFNANSVLPAATRELAAAMSRTAQVLSLPGTAQPFAALPSSEMIARQRFSEVAAKAAQIDAQNVIAARLRSSGLTLPALPAAGQTGGSYAARQALEGISAMQAPSVGMEAKAKAAAQELITAAQDVFPSFSKEFRKNAKTLIPSAAATAAGKTVGQAGDYSKRNAGFGIEMRQYASAAGRAVKRAPFVPGPDPLDDDFRYPFKGIQSAVNKLTKRIKDSIESINIPSLPGRAGVGGGGGGGGGRRGFVGAGSAGGAFDKLNQVLRAFGPLSDRSAADVRELGASLRGLQDIISPLDADFEQVNQAIDKQSRLIDRELQKREKRRGRRRMSPMQMTQAAGAVLSGGIFGGPEGFLGGAIGALGGVGGAFAGAAIGAQVGGLRRQLGEFADYAAEIKRLEIALKGITEVQDDAVASQVNYSRAVAAAADVTKDLNVPQEVAIRGITRLTAAVKGAGGGVADAELAFKNITSAITATGGGAEQVQGAVTALVQIFSKGKVSAEEINQIAERLPGTFNKIAEASGRTGPELTKALQKGEVGLNDLMKFLVQLGGEYGELAEKIAGSSEAAGQRLQVAYNNMRIEIGNALQPIGAEFQDAFTEFIRDITPSLIDAAKSVGEGLRFIIQNKDAIAVAASLALKVAAVNIALKAFAALNGPISTMFILLKSGFKASSQQAALAQGKLIAFGTTVKALAASLVAPLVITFAVVGAEMVISYFNRIKKARADLESTAKKPQGEVFFRSIGGTAATKGTLQRNINDITKNLDILRTRVKSTKEELGSLEETTLITYGGGGGGLPVGGVADKSREDLKTRLQADEAEIKRLVLNYRTLVDKYLDAPDKPALTAFEKPDATGGGTGGGTGDKGPKSQLEQLKAQYESIMRSSKGVLEIEKMRQQQALQLTRATADNNQKLITTTNLNNISLDFAEKEIQIENKLLDALSAANRLELEKDQIQARLNAQLEYQIDMKRLLLQTDGAIAGENQRAAIAAEATSKALADQVFSLREQLGLVTDSERIDRFRQDAEKQFGKDDPEVSQLTDLFRQQVDPTFAEGLQQNMRSLRKEMDSLLDPINQVANAANTIGEAFSNAFTDVVTGSATAKEALGGMMQSIGQSFIEMAAQIIAKQTTMIILGTIMKALGISLGSNPSANGIDGLSIGSPSGFGGGNLFDGSLTSGLGGFRANGGPAKAGQPYMVGERGPELFVPGSNGGVMRNEDLRSLMGRSPAATNTSAMNFTFETTNIGGTEYVSREQLEAAMATTRRQAASDGAKRGMNMTLDRMQNSPRTRARVGIA